MSQGEAERAGCSSAGARLRPHDLGQPGGLPVPLCCVSVAHRHVGAFLPGPCLWSLSAALETGGCGVVCHVPEFQVRRLRPRDSAGFDPAGSGQEPPVVQVCCSRRVPRDLTVATLADGVGLEET